MLYRTFQFLPSTRVVRTANFSRCFYSATGSLVSLGSNGKPVVKEVQIFHGDPNEAYILISPEVGRALQASTVHPKGAAFNQDPERYPLTFFHETKTFAHESSPSFPRLEIRRDLPKQTDINKSPATLFLVGVSHTIALDGTSDARFAEMSAETYKRLKPSLDKLKDM